MFYTNLNFLFELPLIEIKLYNFVYFIVLLSFPILAVASYFIFRKRSEKAKSIYLWRLFGVAFVATWITFVVALIIDDNNQRVNFFARLPLHMCSINVILYPLFFALRNKMPKFVHSATFGYMFFMGSVGALAAMVIDAPSDCAGVGINLLRYNVFSYWLKHGLIFILPIMFVVLGFYKPRFRDIFITLVFILVFLTFMEGVNLLFSWFNKLIGGTEVANFFYTRNSSGMMILKQLEELIGIELIYMFPLIVIIIPVFMIYYLPIGIIDLVKHLKTKKNKTNQVNQA